MSAIGVAEMRFSKIHEKYPHSIAYSETNNDVYFDQKYLEHKLENMIQDCETLLNDESVQIKNKKDSLSNVPIVLPNLKRFRKERDFCLNSILQVNFPNNIFLDTDILEEEVLFLFTCY
jgi:hypothetical protein